MPQPSTQDDAAAKMAPHGFLPPVCATHEHDLAHVDLHSLLSELRDRLAKGDLPVAPSQLISLGDAVCESLATRLDVHENRFSRRRFHDLFWVFHGRLAEPRPPIAGANYLDLGCGAVNPLGMSLLMCMLGAERGIGVDLDVVHDVPRAARGLARLVDAMLQDPRQIVGDYPITRDEIIRNLHGIDVEVLRQGYAEGIGSRLIYRNESASKLSLADGSVQVVMSNSFLEHVDDIDPVLAEIARVTAAGGFGIHSIDGIDHFWYGDSSCPPLGFLCEPGPGMVHGSNRIRPLEFPACFERHGLVVQQVVPIRTTPLTPQEIAGLVPPWSSMSREMLETTSAIVVTQKALAAARQPGKRAVTEERAARPPSRRRGAKE